MSRFCDKVVIVTGAGSGLGRSVAVEFAGEGAKLVLADRHCANNETTVRLVEDAGGEAIAVETDISDRASVVNLISAAVARHGRLDIAINNAGVDQKPTPFLDVDEATFDRVLGINLRGTWLCMQEEIRAMLPFNSGVIVNVTSVTDTSGSPLMSSYVASKHGALGLTRSAAVEFAASGIRINAVGPGGMWTPMLEESARGNPEFAAQGAAAHPIGRIADAKEVARVVLFLASDDASFMIGQTVKVDGGYTVI